MNDSTILWQNIVILIACIWVCSIPERIISSLQGIKDELSTLNGRLRSIDKSIHDGGVELDESITTLASSLYDMYEESNKKDESDSKSNKKYKGYKNSNNGIS